MRLLNDLLNMHDGFNDEGWLKECKKLMIKTFPREDPFSIIVPTGFNIEKVLTTPKLVSRTFVWFLTISFGMGMGVSSPFLRSMVGNV